MQAKSKRVMKKVRGARILDQANEPIARNLTDAVYFTGIPRGFFTLRDTCLLSLSGDWIPARP
ncbi:MAG: hypothetical protein ACLQME_14605, partial [Alphaproteobacteria bacterium]